MAKQRKSKAQRIREQLAKKRKPETIAKAVGCTRAYVKQIEWLAAEKARISKRRASEKRAAKKLARKASNVIPLRRAA